MKWFIITVGLLFLSSCASIDTVKKTIAIKGAEISDTALTEAVWWTCKGASIGSVQRRYGQTKDRAMMYREFCFGQDGVNIVGP